VCIDDGVEANMEKLKALKAEGISILIFPEGTRSQDCSILKFRSGAFALASELELDILPVVLFGPGEILPKGEHILRRGKVAIQLCDAVPYPQLKDWGIRPLKQAQEFRRFYETAYLSLEGKVAQDRKYKNYRDNDRNLYRSEGEMV
ncbi:MAG: 1-acyl-sn-glycerol-3-phosphate acyltransferase, partial [Bacteroidales bacterium]|nr:1-acyl-sn-glycerol-3-phosphate acyltransferase [Bacteroidales bacterium]